MVTDFTFSGWCWGEMDDYDFEAKICSKGSPRGINYGHIVKLFVYDKKSSEEVAVYQQGWDTYPKTEEVLFSTAQIVSCLEKLAKSKKRKT